MPVRSRWALRRRAAAASASTWTSARFGGAGELARGAAVQAVLVQQRVPVSVAGAQHPVQDLLAQPRLDVGELPDQRQDLRREQPAALQPGQQLRRPRDQQRLLHPVPRGHRRQVRPAGHLAVHELPVLLGRLLPQLVEQPGLHRQLARRTAQRLPVGIAHRIALAVPVAEVHAPEGRNALRQERTWGRGRREDLVGIVQARSRNATRGPSRNPLRRSRCDLEGAGTVSFAPSDEPYLFVDVHDSDIATVQYRPTTTATGRSCLGVEPRHDVQDESASEPVDRRAEAEGFAQWVREVHGRDVDPADVLALRAPEEEPDDDGYAFVEDTLERLLDLIGLPLPDQMPSGA